MIRQARAVLLGASLAVLAASAALAQAPAVQQGYYGINTPGGVQDFCAIQLGALPSTIFHPCHVEETVDALGVPHVVSALNPLPVTGSVTTTPAAGSVQPVSGSVTTTPANGSVQPVSGNVTTTPANGSVQPVSGNVTTTPANGSVQPVSGNVTTTPASGSVQPVSGTVTAANLADVLSSGSIAAATLNNAYTVQLANGEGVVGANVSGLSGTGAVLAVEAQSGGPTSPWLGATAVLPGGVLSSTLTSDGNFKINSSGHTAVRLRVSTAATAAAAVAVASVASSSAGLMGLSAPLPAGGNQLGSVLSAGSTGADYSANASAIPVVGSAFASGSVSCPSYVLLKTIPALTTRANVDVENQSGGQVCVVRDDGTAATGAAPVNASVVVLGGGAAAGAQGGSYTSTTFKGRLQIYATSALAQVAAFVE